MYYLEAGQDKRMRNAVLVALVLHVAVVFGVTFRSGEQQTYAPQLEVTLTVRPSEVSPQDARHFAAQDQQGSGEPDKQAALTSPNVDLPANTTRPQRLPRSSEQQEPVTQPELLAAAASAQRRVDEGTEAPWEQSRADGISPQGDQLSRELASMQAEMDERTRNRSDDPRVRRLDSISATRSVDAAYLLDWRRRLEAVGNKYYPEASIRYGIYGELRLLVVIRSDGNLDGIEVLSSSGYAVLDEAAIKIVRMAAPYAPFPPELRATTDKLEIVRTWQFQENSLSSD